MVSLTCGMSWQLRHAYIQDCRPFVRSENIEADAATLSIDVRVKHTRSKFTLQTESEVRRQGETRRGCRGTCGGSFGYRGPNLRDTLYSRPSYTVPLLPWMVPSHSNKLSSLGNADIPSSPHICIRQLRQLAQLFSRRYHNNERMICVDNYQNGSRLMRYH